MNNNSDGPYAGALDAESPPKLFFTFLVGHKIGVFLRIYTIMREAVSISNGSRILPSPLSFLHFSKFTFLAYFLEPIWAMVTRPVQGPYYYLVFRQGSLAFNE